MSIQLEMPRLSESLTEGVIIRWLKQVNEHIEIGEPVAEIETAKTNLELLAEYDGRIIEILAPEGSKIQTGQPIVMFERDQAAPYTSSPQPREKKTASRSTKITPLAKKLAQEKGMDTASIKGSGPRGKIMSSDLNKQGSITNSNNLPIARKASQENRIIAPATRINDYYVYTFEANMSQLAEISTPIAVQSEKFLGGRYCLFDYVARAAVRAFTHVPSTLNEKGNIDALMVVNHGDKDIPLPEAANKTIYDIAINRNIGEPEEALVSMPENYTPNLIICDAGAQVDNISSRINGRPTGLVILGGTSPKTGIEAGRPIQKLMLPITIYIDAAQMDETGTTQIAGEFKSLMENPVLLLF